MRRMNWKYPKSTHGFTLVELLIALFIFSLVSLGALQALQHFTQNQPQAEAVADELNQLSLTYAFLLQDMAQLRPSPAPDPAEHEDEPPLATTLQWQDQNTLLLQRSHLDTAGQISKAQRIRYTFKPTQVLRRQGNSTEELLANIQDLTVEWYEPQQGWQVLTASRDLSSAQALRLHFKHPRFGSISWSFLCDHSW